MSNEDKIEEPKEEVKNSTITMDECVTQGDCVVCGAKDVKGKLGKFPVCYACYSNKKAVKWVVNVSLKFLKDKKETIDYKHLETLGEEQKARLLTDMCQNYIEEKKV